jgi:putative tricarboxylic transport membrane protein
VSSQRHQSAIGLGALILAACMAAGASTIPSAAGYAGVGPNFLPWVVSLVLAVCGGWLLVQARQGGWLEMEAPSGAAQADWRAAAWVVAGILAVAVLLTTLGFILACTLCFMLAVRGLRQAESKGHGGLRGLVMDFVTGFLIAGPAFWLFTQVLNINLPGLTKTGWL